MFWWSGNCITFPSRPIFLVSSYLPIKTSLLLCRYLSCPVLILFPSSLFFPILNVVFHHYSSNIFYLPLPCHHFLSFLFYLFYPSLTLLCHFPSPCWIYVLFLLLPVSPFEHYTAVTDSMTESPAEKSPAEGLIWNKNTIYLLTPQGSHSSLSCQTGDQPRSISNHHVSYQTRCGQSQKCHTQGSPETEEALFCCNILKHW